MTAFEAVPRIGCVVQDPDEPVPWLVEDGSGCRIEPINQFLRDLVAGDSSPLTVYSYANDLLRWFRFLWASRMEWDRAGRDQTRDFVLWMRESPNPQRERRRPGAPPAGSLNSRTGKPYLAARYAPTSINHALSVVRQFYEFHREGGRGPLVNPIPEPRRGRGRLNAHHNPMDPVAPHRRGSYRQKVPDPSPRGISDALFDELFEAMTSNRDKALLALYVSSGARASELLGLCGADVHWGEHMITVVSKGSRLRERVPASPDAFVWLALYLDEGFQRPAEEPLWWTLRAPTRPLTYGATRAMLNRANAKLGTNLTLHDLRHTCGIRLARDPNMTLVDIKTILRHKSVETTQIYTRVRLEEIIEQVLAHYARPAPTPVLNSAVGYDADELRELFG